MEIKTDTSTVSKALFEYVAQIILIPKTLFKVLVRPSWTVDYINLRESHELDADHDKYSPPVLFWVITGILPYYFIINTYFLGFTEGDILTAYKSLNTLSMVWGLTVFLVSFPISCAFILQLFKYKGFVKSTFKRSFFIQLYLTGPVQLFYILLLFAGRMSDFYAIIFIIIGLGTLAWFMIAEFKVIRKELNYNVVASIAVLILMYVFFYAFAAICCVLFFLTNMSAFQILANAWLGDIKIN
jgi:hypothetical protein